MNPGIGCPEKTSTPVTQPSNSASEVCQPQIMKQLQSCFNLTVLHLCQIVVLYSWSTLSEVQCVVIYRQKWNINFQLVMYLFLKMHLSIQGEQKNIDCQPCLQNRNFDYSSFPFRFPEFTQFLLESSNRHKCNLICLCLS